MDLDAAAQLSHYVSLQEHENTLGQLYFLKCGRRGLRSREGVKKYEVWSVNGHEICLGQ